MTHLATQSVRELTVHGASYRYFSLPGAAQDPALGGLAQLPYSLRILAENLLRHAGAPDIDAGMLRALARGERGFEIPFRPARVLLQDLLLGVRAVVAESFERIHRSGGRIDEVAVVCRIDTEEELTYYRHGGILPYVYRELVAQISRT